MSIIPLLFITNFISGVALFSITGYSKYARLKERQEAARNASLFIQDFPILWWITLLTIFFSSGFLILCFAKFNIETLMDKEFILNDHIIPFIIMITVLLPVSVKNYLSSSRELKYSKPYLFLSVLLMAFFDSITLSILFIGFIGLFKK